jgi:protein-S-isoprenylcysteine O-methyltransferase Ste14
MVGPSLAGNYCLQTERLQQGTQCWVVTQFPIAEVLLLVRRIFGEEKLLARDLEGYKEYLEKVSYRLVPHIW